ncbi:MAG: hydantoinase B/oxoprolinase family protein [Verrucomicrobia bacterium]|nr:hydantoinase B/oxoprolinase family protein [Verrucomicrobiota bacterium]
MVQVWEFWIDTGGTFTDCLGKGPDGNWHRAKVLSSSSIRASIRDVGTRSLLVDLPEDYPDDFFKEFRVRLPNSDVEATVLFFKSDRNELMLDQAVFNSDQVGDLVELQYKGEAPELAARVITGTPGNERLPESRLRLATTKGTNALLEGKGAPTVLFINQGLGDLLQINTQQRPDLFALNIVRPKPLYESVVEVPMDASTGSPVLESLSDEVENLLARGVSTAAICLMHSYQDGRAEEKLVEFLREKGFNTVVASSECAPFIKILPRAETTLVDAYLSPVLNSYLERIVSEFGGEGLSVMTSSGGLVPSDSFRARDSLFSGPAGGVIGAVGVGKQSGASKIIGFDMGGTSTDVTRYQGVLAYQFETRVGDTRILAPSLKIETVAAGGGSICQFDGERLRVGPESAGAEPGPACYGTGGPLTVTDVNLLLGRMDAAQFGIPVVLKKSREELEVLMQRLHAGGEDCSSDSLLAGLLEIANENMTDAIRKISTGEGYDPSEYALVAFGGAGGQHACGIAEKLGIITVLFPNDAGLLSAAGLSQALVEGFAEHQTLCSFEEFESKSVSLTADLEDAARAKLNPGDRKETALSRRIVSFRLLGQETALDLDWLPNESLLDKFSGLYQSTFGYIPDLKSIEVVCYRVVVSSVALPIDEEHFPDPGVQPTPLKSQRAFSGDQWVEADIFARSDFLPGMQIKGPAIIQDPFSTLVVDAGWMARVGTRRTLRLEFTGETRALKVNARAVEIELFSNRFQTLVEDMGVRLMRTAVSTNVKDRHDFSCGL